MGPEEVPQIYRRLKHKCVEVFDKGTRQPISYFSLDDRNTTDQDSRAIINEVNKKDKMSTIAKTKRCQIATRAFSWVYYQIKRKL